MSGRDAVYNLLISNEFQKMNNLRKEMYWSSFFMAGFDIYNPAPGYAGKGDPRGTSGFAEFAVKNNTPLYYLYPKKITNGDTEMNFVFLPDAADKVNSFLLDYNNHTKIDDDIKTEILALIAGARYFNKYKSSDSLDCTYTDNNHQTEILNICTGLFDRVQNQGDLIEFVNENLSTIDTNIASIEKWNNWVSLEEFSNARKYIISSSLSYASEDLKQEYYDQKSNYEKMINNIYNAAAGAGNLTLCINNALIGSVDSNGDSFAYIDIDQVNYCDNDYQTNEYQDEKINNINDAIYKIKIRINAITVALQIIIIILILVFVYKIFVIRKYDTY